MLYLVLEHAEVPAEVDEGGALVVELDLQRAFLGLRHLSDRGGRVIVDVVASDQPDDVGGMNDNARHSAFAVLAIHLVSNLGSGPVNHFSDVAETDLGEFADNLLNGHACALSALGKDLIDPRSNQSISKQACCVHVGRCPYSIVARSLVRTCCGLPLSDFLSEPLMAAIGEGWHGLETRCRG